MQPFQLNVEYWYRLLYECLRGTCYGSADTFTGLLMRLWFWIVIVGYLLSLIGLFVIVYATMRLFELRKREEAYYTELIAPPGARGAENPRWQHIQSLMESSDPSRWREAITEADIMLDDLLTRKGYTGASIGEKLKSAVRSEFRTLDDAWEAHKVRNQIAHEGSAFDLSENLARRTIARYENVFREFDAL
ncbi:hypothetical protein HYV30_00960 [Candidatus Kaiserbacteria bacterium]|nr:hypothetical protein [Candidatus Kaiserbacteria bacterium]